MKTLSIVLAGATLLSLAACGGKAADVIHNLGQNPKKVESEAAYAKGAWVSTCQTVTGINLGAPIQSYNTVDAMKIGDMSRVRTYFASPDCKDAQMAVNENIQFSFGDNTGGDNWAFDYTITSVQATALTEDAASKLTTLGYCSLAKWENNKPQDISHVAGTEPLKCFGTNLKDVTQFGVVQVTGPSDSKVYYSKFVTDRAARPTEADASATAVVYTRP